MPPQPSYTDDLKRMRSLLIVTALQKRQDIEAMRRVQSCDALLTWEPLENLMIDDQVWAYAVARNGYNPKLVFCHPDVIMREPMTCLYYRGLTGLSQKAAKHYVGAIEQIEAGAPNARLNANKALKIARTYNMFVCSIINASADWTLENGRRTIIATLGISLDGVMRNQIGDVAEERLRSLIVEWLLDRSLVVEPVLAKSELAQELPARYTLSDGAIMEFRSEPDISFQREGRLLAVIEIKGGVDPAGALERLGAAKKSFGDSRASSPHCKCFYVAGVLTPEVRARIEMDAMFEKAYDLTQLLTDPAAKDEFLTEIFHHTLRLL